MTGNQTMDYYVRPQHLYSHSRTCTHRNCVEDFPNWWHSIYATSLIMTVFMRFHLSWLDSSICQIFTAIMEILIHYISSSFMEIMILCISSPWRFLSKSLFYMAMTTHVIFCIMPIHGHCTLMYLGLLHLLAVMCRVWSLYCTDWMAGSSTGFFITSLLG